jgi:hypothetical protein
VASGSLPAPGREATADFTPPASAYVARHTAVSGGVQPPRSGCARAYSGPNFEFHPPREAVESGFFEPCYRGAAGYRRYVSELSDVWGPDMRIESMELIDMGDRLVMLFDAPVRARASGVLLTGKLASVATLANGRVIHQQDYFHHDEAVEAVGLR